ncbi:hypothetical protein KY285_010346 [Solanum tuberosum]|nr:hypothetical protein KY289_013061 [Solanum tuberosum]KAH0734639.1 hypothetical protein KY285_010346 [Solanum tuberosum]
MSVMIVTSLGDMVVDLFTDRCPLTCKNFLKLCNIKYYHNCLFHTVRKDFTMQTGDPTGTGFGGDSIYNFLYGDRARFFGDEIHSDLKHSKRGTVAMASAGTGTEGFYTLNRINKAYVDDKGKPYQNIRIKHTYILYDRFDDPSQLADLIPDASPERKPKDEIDDDVRLEDDWMPKDEELGIREEKEAHTRAVILESVGDIPDAEMNPPDNVLFVCKLNPSTEEKTLYIILSRFGTVTSAEIIRDHKNGDSHCYAFIEFEDKESSEQAYFKMDNTQIDDRRIRVDFSQSVAKLWSEYLPRNQRGSVRFNNGSVDTINRKKKRTSSMAEMTRNALSGTYSAPQRSASSAAILVDDLTMMRDRGGNFVLPRADVMKLRDRLRNEELAAGSIFCRLRKRTLRHEATSDVGHRREMCAHARILALEEAIDTEWVYMWDKFGGYLLLLFGLTAKAERIQVTMRCKLLVCILASLSSSSSSHFPFPLYAEHSMLCQDEVRLRHLKTSNDPFNLSFVLIHRS